MAEKFNNNLKYTLKIDLNRYLINNKTDVCVTYSVCVLW